MSDEELFLVVEDSSNTRYNALKNRVKIGSKKGMELRLNFPGVPSKAAVVFKNMITVDKKQSLLVNGKTLTKADGKTLLKNGDLIVVTGGDCPRILVTSEPDTATFPVADETAATDTTVDSTAEAAPDATATTDAQAAAAAESAETIEGGALNVTVAAPIATDAAASEAKTTGDTTSDKPASTSEDAYLVYKTTVIKLAEGKRVQIGRMGDNDIVCAEDDVSRSHCFVVGFTIHDKGSTCGTTVNNVVVTKDQPVKLSHGDIILVGGSARILVSANPVRTMHTHSSVILDTAPDPNRAVFNKRSVVGLKSNSLNSSYSKSKQIARKDWKTEYHNLQAHMLYEGATHPALETEKARTKKLLARNLELKGKNEQLNIALAVAQEEQQNTLKKTLKLVEQMNKIKPAPAVNVREMEGTLTKAMGSLIADMHKHGDAKVMSKLDQVLALSSKKPETAAAPAALDTSQLEEQLASLATTVSGHSKAVDQRITTFLEKEQKKTRAVTEGAKRSARAADGAQVEDAGQGG